MIPELLYTKFEIVQVSRPTPAGEWQDQPGVVLRLSNYEFEVLVRMAMKYRHLEPDLPTLSQVAAGEYNGPRLPGADHA